MTTKDRIDTRGRWFTGLGITVSAIGAALYYWLERHSFVATDDSLFSFLAMAFWPPLLVGPLLIMAGGILWAWRTTSRNLLIGGAGLTAAFWVAPYVIPINVHGWSAALLLPILCGFLLGIICLVLAVGRFVFRRVAGSASDGSGRPAS